MGGHASGPQPPAQGPDPGDGDAGFIAGATLVELRESMMGGGGPACLRLRVPAACVRAERRLDAAAIVRLRAVVDRLWPERLRPADLADPELPEIDRRARDGLMMS